MALGNLQDGPFVFDLIQAGLKQRGHRKAPNEPIIII